MIMSAKTSEPPGRPLRARKRIVFSPERVRRALIYVHKVMLDIVDADYQAAYLTLEQAPAADINRELDRLDACRGELALMGVRVEDACRGEAWFPTRHNDQRAWIVWRLNRPDKLTWRYDGDHAAERKIETFKE